MKEGIDMIDSFDDVLKARRSTRNTLKKVYPRKTCNK